MNVYVFFIYISFGKFSYNVFIYSIESKQTSSPFWDGQHPLISDKCSSIFRSLYSPTLERTTLRRYLVTDKCLDLYTYYMYTGW